VTHDFKLCDRVFNGGARATVWRLIADDALEVIYDCDPDREPVCEPAFYFKRLAICNAGITDPIGTATGATPEDALDDADRIIAALPDIATTNLHRHLARIAYCVDKARDDGIADEYVQPLRMTVAAITANLLPPPVK